MKLLDRHISQAVLLAMIVVLGVVVALDFIFSWLMSWGRPVSIIMQATL